MKIAKLMLQNNNQGELKLIDVSGHLFDGTATEMQPEKVLLFSVLNRAVCDVWDGNKREEGLLRGWEWMLFTRNEREPFTFGWICEQLSDQPEALADRIIELADEGRKMHNIKTAVRDLHNWRSGYANDFVKGLFDLFMMSNDLELQKFRYGWREHVTAYELWRETKSEEKFFEKHLGVSNKRKGLSRVLPGGRVEDVHT